LERQASFLAPYILLPQKQLKNFVNSRVKDWGGVDCMVLEHFQILIEDIKKHF
jgi:Zn-dependent peptidase ImmA (M78 family)